MAESTDLMVADKDNDNDAYESGLGDEKKSGLMSSFGDFDVLRQVILVLALAICIAIAVFVMLWAQEPTYRPLAKMDTEQLISTLDYLDANSIDYKVEGNTVFVTEHEYDSIKLEMTRSGIDYGREADGSELLLMEQGFGVSQRLEQQRLMLAREQQLGSAIAQMEAVRSARVLLALPKENVFARREKEPSASVMLNVRSANALREEEIASIVDMVASAVTGLAPNQVTVTDQNGRLLNSGSQTELSSRSSREYKLERRREEEYLNKIDGILIPVLGYDNYTAQVDVAMDFSTQEQTQRTFNPDMPAVRSEMLIENNSSGGTVAGIPGALTNQPPLDANIPEQAVGTGAATGQASGSNSSETTRNYELDSTTSYTRQQTGTIKRLSVSVAVDYKEGVNAEGERELTPRSAEELANIRRLLQGGVGFNINRGDTVEVITVPFAELPEITVSEPAIWEDPWFWRGVRLVIGGLVIIVLILTVVRPMLKRLIDPASGDSDGLDDMLARDDDLGDETIDMLSAEFDQDAVGFAADGRLQLPDLHKDEDLLKAVRALVANEPELSSQVVKSWLNEDA